MYSGKRRKVGSEEGAAQGALAACVAIMLLFATGYSPMVFAQKKTGTTIGQTLLIEPSARMAGMGNAGVATFEGAMSGYFNPGALGHLPTSSVQFTHGLWVVGMTYDYAAAAVRIGSANTLYLAVTSFNSGEMKVRTVAQPQGTGENFTKEDLTFGLGYGRRFTDRFSAGLQVKYHREQIWHSALTALAVDLGIVYELPFGAHLGASLSNFGTSGRYDGRDLRIRFDQDPDRFGDNSNLPAELETETYPLPVFFRVGVGYPFTISAYNEALLTINAYHPNDNAESVSVGGEWTFMDVLSVRAGYQNLFLDEAQGGLTLGGGIQYDVTDYTLEFDYAWNDAGEVGAATRDIQRFTFGFYF